MSDLEREAAAFAVADLGLVIEPAALAAARRSVDESGLLLLGEVHGVMENPLLIHSLMRALGLGGLALEWDEDLMPAVSAFLAGERLADHRLLWFGDGRITAGHLAVLRELAAAGPLRLGLFDGAINADWDWSARDEAMARRILAAPPAEGGTLVVAGNAHTPTVRTDLGLPRQFHRSADSGPRQPRLHEQDGSLILELPIATEAVVPQQPMPWLAGPQPG